MFVRELVLIKDTSLESAVTSMRESSKMNLMMDLGKEYLRQRG